MRKSIPIFISLLLFVILFSAYYVKIHPDLDAPENTLLKCIDRANAKLTDAETYFWAKLNGDRLSGFSSLEALGNQLVREVGLKKEGVDTQEPPVRAKEDGLHINGKLDNGREVGINLLQKEGKEGYITINVKENLEDIKLQETRKSIPEALKKLGIDPSVNTCLRGVLEGKLDERRLKALNGLVLETAEAKEVESIKDGYLLSVTAYSPSMGNYMKVGGKRVNFNFAARYSPLGNETYIWLATPVITIEY